MKKLVVIIICTLLLFSGCSSQKKYLKYLEKRVEDLESENEELKEKLSNNGEISIDTVEITTPIPTDIPVSIIDINEEITVNRICSFTLQSLVFTKKVQSSNPSKYGSTSLKCDNDGMIYYDIIFTIKNISNTGLQAKDFISVIVMYDDIYEYSTFSVYEQDDGRDLWKSTENVNPLQTVKLHFIAEVPIYIADDDKSIDIVISCSGNEFIYSVK